MNYDQETRSEAAGNYGAAALLIAGAFFCAAVGIGYMKETLFPRKPKDGDIGDYFAQELSKAVKDALSQKNAHEIKGESIVQDTLPAAVTFYVKKSFKPEVKVGDLLPDTFLVAKPDMISDQDWASMDNVKFTSSHKISIGGKSTLFEVGELL